MRVALPSASRLGWHTQTLKRASVVADSRSSFAKLNLADVTSDVNEKHLESWNQMLQTSDPPVQSDTPVSPVIPADLLGPEAISFDNTALQRLTGWRPQHSLTVEIVQEMVDGFVSEGYWPVVRKAKLKK